ncbi:MAG: 4Fe-4S dicluster domain-containing protein [Alphaproteobacteria bacterium]|nr:4Fe-4S dicluster domain-containing protein [Alphaproteobacteria bacterium]
MAELNEQFAASDAAAGIEVSDAFEPFNQMNDMFTRAFWDDNIRSDDTDAFFASYRSASMPRRGEGFTQKDFALRNASWIVSDLISNRNNDEGEREGFQAPIRNDTPVADTQVPVDNAQEQAREIKSLAKMFGADLVGITQIDPRWHYSARVDTRDFSPAPNDLPAGLTHVIVMGHAMDEDLVATYPSALAGAATGMEYSHEASIVIQLAAYIRNLGYEAVPSMNDTALVIPYAVKAGLGEYGRNQMVLTPEFGPRVRFSKIFTSLPLAVDAPKPFGIRAYCDICTKCADACPPKALPFGPPQEDNASQSTIKGVKKWSANCEKCFGYWAKLKSDCAICMRVCPFNQPKSTIYGRIFNFLATSRFRKLALHLETRRGMVARLKPGQWWRRLSGGPAHAIRK